MRNLITSRQNEQIKHLIKIKKNPTDYFVIEGEHALEIALQFGRVLQVFTVEDREVGDAVLTFITLDVAKKLSSKVSPSKVFALCYARDKLLDTNKHLLYLDGVSDPGNAGTLIRTALAFGFGGVIFGEGTVNPYNDKVLSSAQGAHFKIPIVQEDWKLLKNLKKDNYKVVTTVLNHESTKISNFKQNKCVLVLGNEARGISEEVYAVRDYNTIIPIALIDSLNVAVAGSILMYLLNANN